MTDEAAIIKATMIREKSFYSSDRRELTRLLSPALSAKIMLMSFLPSVANKQTLHKKGKT